VKRFEEVADRVYVYHYDLFSQGIGVIATSDGLIVVDTRSSHRQGGEILNDIRDTIGHGEPLDVHHVINTHRHSDHTFGNHVFRPARIWAHELCATGLREHGARDRDDLIQSYPDADDEYREVTIDVAESTFRATARIVEGDRMITLSFLGRGHTDADVVVAVDDADVVFAGDLVVVDEPPYFGDSYPLDWPDTLRRLDDLGYSTLVPGHGRVADRAYISAFRSELDSVVTLARAAVEKKLTVEEAVVAAPWSGSAEVREGLNRAIADVMKQDL
jgi:glyoxylase-like metal-dependent hydrolase (beta-lactamase superfamily II)